jgi:RNA polymerase sigma-70 factor (ECF subfamily)
MDNVPQPAEEPRLSEILGQCRESLKRAVALRIDARLAGRVDASDVVQDAMLEATARYAEYRANPSMPLHLWLRLITIQRLALVHRQHLSVRARDVRREIPLRTSAIADSSQATPAALTSWLIGRLSSPSHAATREELRLQIEQCLAQLDPLDREVLALRHFEQLSHADAARVLSISEAAASKRYVRALRRLRKTMAALGLDEGRRA